MEVKWKETNRVFGIATIVAIRKAERRFDMEQYDNTNRGVLFIKHERRSDKSPTMTGKINVDGKDFYLSAWTNHKRTDGEKYLTLAVTPVDETQKTQNKNTSVGLDPDDDVPF